MAWSSSLIIDAVAALVVVAGLAVCLPRCLRTVGCHQLPFPLIMFAVGAVLAWCSTELQSHASDSGDALSTSIDDNDVNEDETEGSAGRWRTLRAAPVLQGLGAVHALRVASPQLAYWLVLPPIVFTATASLPWASLQQFNSDISSSSRSVGFTHLFPWAAQGFAGSGTLVCGGGIAVAVKWLLPRAGEWSCAQAVALGACLAVSDPTAAVTVLRQRGAPSSRLPALLEAESALSLGAAALAFAAAAAAAISGTQGFEPAIPMASGSSSRSDSSGDWLYGDEDSLSEWSLWVLRLLRLIVGGLVCGLLALLFLWLVVAPSRWSTFSAGAPIGSSLHHAHSGAHAGLAAAVASYGAFFAAEALLQASGVAAAVVLGLGVAHGAGLAPTSSSSFSLAHSSGVGSDIGTFRRPGVGWAASLVPWTNGGANHNGARTLAVVLEWALYFAAGTASQRAFVRSTAGTKWLDFQGSIDSETSSLSALELVANAILLVVVAIVFRGIALILFERVSAYRCSKQGSLLGSQSNNDDIDSSSDNSWSTRELLSAWVGGVPRFGALAIALALQVSQRTPSGSYSNSSSSSQSEDELRRQEFLLYVCGAVLLSHLAGNYVGLLLLESQTLWPYPSADKEAWARAAGLRRAVAKLEARTHGRKWAAQHRQALWGDPAASQTGSSSNNNKSSGEEEEGGKRESIGPPIFGDGGDGSNGSSSHNDDDILALSLVPSFLGGDVRVRGDGAVSLLDKHGKPLVVDSATAVLNLFVRGKEDKGHQTQKTEAGKQRHEEKANVDENVGTNIIYTNGTNGWRLDLQNALEAAVNPNSSNGRTSGSVSLTATPSKDTATSEADSSSSYLTDFKQLLAAGLEVQHVQSHGASKRPTSFRALFAHGQNASTMERAVLYAEDARCRTLLLSSSKRDPNPLMFRAADLVSSKEVNVPSLGPSAIALLLTFYVPGGGIREGTTSAAGSALAAKKSTTEEGKVEDIESNARNKTEGNEGDDDIDVSDEQKGLKSVALIIESVTVRTYLSTMLVEHAQAELLRRNNAHENRFQNREALAKVTISTSNSDGGGNEEWFSVVRSLSGEEYSEPDNMPSSSHSRLSKRNGSSSNSGGGGTTVWASVDDEEDEDDDDDDDEDDLEHGRFGRFVLGDSAAFRLKSRYTRSLAALPCASSRNVSGAGLPWLLHARGGAQSWPLRSSSQSGVNLSTFGATSVATNMAIVEGSPWRPVQAHEVNAVHRVFAVMAELYENALAAGLVDDAALQLVVHANAAAHHHLQGALADLTTHGTLRVSFNGNSSPALTVEAQASLAASADSFDDDASALTQGALNISSGKGKEKSAAHKDDTSNSGDDSKSVPQGWSSLMRSRARVVHNMAAAVGAAQHRGGAAAHPRERQARREACLEASLLRGCDVFLVSLPTPAGGIPTGTTNSGGASSRQKDTSLNSAEGNDSSMGHVNSKAHQLRQALYEWLPLARPWLRLEAYREVHTSVLAIAAFVRAHRDLPSALQTCRALRPVALQRITVVCADICSRACAKLQELALAFPLVVRTARVVALALDLAHLKALEVMRLHNARWLDAHQAACLIAPLYHAQRGLHDAKNCFEVNRLVLGFDLNLNLLRAATAAAEKQQQQDNISAATNVSSSIGREDPMRALEVKAKANAAAAAAAWGVPIHIEDGDDEDDDEADEAKTNGRGGVAVARLPVRVVLRGLDGELECLNGQEGDLVAYDDDARMFTVQLESGAQVMELLKEHLTVPHNNDNDAASGDVSGADSSLNHESSPSSALDPQRGSQAYDPALHMASSSSGSSLYSLKGTDPSAPLSEGDDNINEDDDNPDESRYENNNNDSKDNNDDDDDESSMADQSIASGAVEFAVAATPVRESALKRLSMSVSRLAGRAQASRAKEPKKSKATLSQQQQQSSADVESSTSGDGGGAATSAATAAEANFLSAVNSLAAEEGDLLGGGIHEGSSDEESLQLLEPEDKYNDGYDDDVNSSAKFDAKNEDDDGERSDNRDGGKEDNDDGNEGKDNATEAVVDDSPSKSHRAAGEHFPRANFEVEHPEAASPPTHGGSEGIVTGSSTSSHDSSSNDGGTSSSSSLATPLVAAPARPVLAAPTRGKGKGVGKGGRGKGAPGPGAGKGSGGRLPVAMRSMSEGRPSADFVISSSSSSSSSGGGRGAGRGQGGKGKGGKGLAVEMRAVSFGRPENSEITAAPSSTSAPPPAPIVEMPKVAAPPAAAPAAATVAAAKPKLTAAEQKVAKARQAKAKREAASAAEAEAAQARAVKAAANGAD